MLSYPNPAHQHHHHQSQHQQQYMQTPASMTMSFQRQTGQDNGASQTATESSQNPLKLSAGGDDVELQTTSIKDHSDSNTSDEAEEGDDDNESEAMPRALVAGRQDETTSLKRRDRSDDDDDDDVDELLEDSRASGVKSRRLELRDAPSTYPASGPTTAAGHDGRVDEGNVDRSSDVSPEVALSPHQTEIKTQRPLGLLAQHRLQTASTTSRPSELSHCRDQTSSRDLSDGSEDEERRLRELFSSSRSDGGQLASDKTAAAVNYSIQPSLPPTPTSAGVNVGLDFSTAAASRFDSLMDRRFIPSPPLSSSPCSGHEEPVSPLDSSTSAGHRHWTFQEQFKQLYEMSDDVKRKEFLDELFTFMQKRGTPVNRIPIMAKQTLDLYELFRLVVSKGGLVEVINKKLWREITKGLNLPSSITSAAFTLRTQYMKYLYPFECEKLKLSTLAELQYAVDGNRREGRRPSYGGQEFSPLPPGSVPPPPPPPGPHMHAAAQGASIMSMTSTGPQNMADGLNAAAIAAAAAAAARTNGLLGFVTRDNERLQLSQHQQQSLQTVNQLRTLAECDSRAMEAAARAMQEAMVKRIEEATSRAAAAAIASSGSKVTPAPPAPQMKLEEPPTPSAGKRSRPTDDGASLQAPPPPIPTPVVVGRGGVGAAHIKLTSRNDGRSEFDSSIVASMEINGIVYQGVLFAQNPQILGRI